jgi:hypothetical protein
LIKLSWIRDAENVMACLALVPADLENGEFVEMNGQRVLPAIFVLLFAGCSFSPVFQLERPALERALPRDVSMSDIVEEDWTGKVTVAEKLARLGAYPDGDKIRDGTGQEIRFVHHEERALKTTPNLQKQEQDRARELSRYCRVIEIQPNSKDSVRQPQAPGKDSPAPINVMSATFSASPPSTSSWQPVK